MDGFSMSYIFDISGESFFLSFVTFYHPKRNTFPLSLLTNESFLLTYISTSLPYPLLFSIKKWYIFPWLKRVKEKGRLKKREGGAVGRYAYLPIKNY